MPFDRSKYPKDWGTVIRPRILQREGSRCKFCQLPNYEIIHRDRQGTSLGTCYVCMSGGTCTEPGRSVRIVLTIAHLNHDVTDNRDENLAALCQQCHLRLDIDQHTASRAATRAQKRSIADGQLMMMDYHIDGDPPEVDDTDWFGNPLGSPEAAAASNEIVTSHAEWARLMQLSPEQVDASAKAARL